MTPITLETITEIERLAHRPRSCASSKDLFAALKRSLVLPKVFSDIEDLHDVWLTLEKSGQEEMAERVREQARLIRSEQ